MLKLSRGDDKLLSLVGQSIASSDEGATYRIEAPLGFGAVAVSFYALKVTPYAAVPVVVKLLRPSFVRQFGMIARLTVEREVIALRRLNEQVPPNPFVVRLLDDGTVPVELRGDRVELPWLVLEYVHGGTHGTTLAQRVEHSLATFGHAFSPQRALHAVECLTQALEAVHEVGVVHRGLTPNNVLCAGFQDDEVFKIADFGVARPIGWAGQSAGLPLGTPGYLAPELFAATAEDIGPWTDTFALGAMVFYMLTGEHLFPVHDMDLALEAIHAPKRRSIRECPALPAELREREGACRSIDFVIGWATADDPKSRIAEVSGLSAMLAPYLRSESMRPPFFMLPEPTFDGGAHAEAWAFRSMQQAGQVGVIRSVAWDGPDRCLAATNEGLYFWTGTEWSAAVVSGLPDPRGIRFVRRIAPGRWILGGDGSMLAIYTTGGVTRIVRGPEPSGRFDQLSGQLDDVALLVSSPAPTTVSAAARPVPPTIHTFIGKRWLKPFPLQDVAALGGVAHVEDARWLLAGRSVDGKSWAALFSPLDVRLEGVQTPEHGAFTACTGQPRLSLGLAVGSEGMVLWKEGSSVRLELIDGQPGLSAAYIDTAGRGWVASAGAIWLREANASSRHEGSAWERIWRDDSAYAPIVSLFAEEGRVIAMTADGGLLEARSELDEEARTESRRFAR